MNVADVVLVGLVADRPQNLVLDDLREPENGVKRRPEFVAHGREEARLGKVRLFGAPSRFVR